MHYLNNLFHGFKCIERANILPRKAEEKCEHPHILDVSKARK